MADEWPPDGYSTPREYTSSDRWMLAIGLSLILPVIILTRSAMGSGATRLAEWSTQVGESVGLLTQPFLFHGMMLLVVVGWILISTTTIIVFHEGIHYALGAIANANPQFEIHTQLSLPNPSVVAYHKGINRRTNAMMLGGPFVVLSIVCATVMWTTSGVLAATAAIMFAINAVPSCGDLYHVCRIAMMPPGTLFANFEEDGGLRTEVVTPKPSA